MKYFKRMLLPFVLGAISTVLSCSDDSSVNTSESALPNVILIIADDLGWDAFGDYPGASSMKANTPTLDSLARNGVTFLNFWTNPVCAPTRAALLTGKFGFRTGVGGAQNPQIATLSNSEQIIQKYLSENTSNAYASAVIGKWHVSASDDLNAPENLGVDYFSGVFRGAVQDYYNWTQTSAGNQTNITTYTTTHFVNQSLDWIDEQSKPFFLWLSFNAPHTPFHRPPLELITDQLLLNDLATINNNPLPYYLASVEAMDTEIGRLIHSLSNEQKENTIFIFMSDNGTPSQVAQSPYTASGAKNTLFQGGVNVPLMISGKGVSRKNMIETAQTQVTDLFALVADLAGTGIESYQDGSTLRPLLSAEGSGERSFMYTEQFGNNATDNDGYAIRNEVYKLIELENGTEYLYDLIADPFEQGNLLSDPLSVEAQQNLDALKALKAGL